MATFRCRKCRILLFSVRELESHTVSTNQVNQVNSDLACFDKCSSWFLKDEDILPWIAESVEEVGLREEYLDWTNGSSENEALENEDRSTKHPKLENEAPKSRKRSTQKLENEDP